MKKLTKTEFKELIPVVLEKFETKKRSVLRFKNNFWGFFNTYLAHYKQEESPEFHKEIVDLILSKHQKIAIAAPRGFSKSTLVSFAFVLWVAMFRKFKFVVILSASDDLAEDLSRFIREECFDNVSLMNDFNLKISGVGANGDFVINKTRILARGKNQAVRGFRFREHRPDLIILDDVEKDTEARSPKVIQKTLDLINRALIPSLSPKGKLVFLGTIVQKYSVAGTILLSDQEPWVFWERRIYQALTRTGLGEEVSIWEERFSTEFLKNQRNLIGLSAFNSEFQNQPSDDALGFFREEMFKAKDLDSQEMVLFIDPSVDGIKNNDYKAGVLLGRDRENFEICEVILQQGTDRPFFEKILALYQRYQEKILGVYIENNGFQVYYQKELEKFAQERGVILRISGMKHFQKKELRILKLLPLFETGKIVFKPEFIKSKEYRLLMEQLIYFPNSAVHDDAPDALAGAVEAFEKLKMPQSQYTVVPRMPKRRF